MSLSSNPSIVIVHVSEAIAEGLLAFPLLEAGFPILAVSYYKENIIPLLTKHQPDVLIVNLGFYGQDTQVAVAKHFPQLKVVVITASGSADYFASLTEYLFAIGRVHAFIGLSDTYNLEDAVRAAARNELYLSQPR